MTATKEATPVVPEAVQPGQVNPTDLANRQKNNVRLGWVCGAIAMAVFSLALWKIRIT